MFALLFDLAFILLMILLFCATLRFLGITTTAAQTKMCFTALVIIFAPELIPLYGLWYAWKLCRHPEPNN